MDLSRFKFYAAGKQVSRKHHDKLMAGKAKARIGWKKKDQPGSFYWAFRGFVIGSKNGVLDREDPLMVETLWATGLKYEETYLMVREPVEPMTDILEHQTLAYVCKYERPIR